jgi:hypothetical protein
MKRKKRMKRRVRRELAEDEQVKEVSILKQAEKPTNRGGKKRDKEETRFGTNPFIQGFDFIKKFREMK